MKLLNFTLSILGSGAILCNAEIDYTQKCTVACREMWQPTNQDDRLENQKNAMQVCHKWHKQGAQVGKLCLTSFTYSASSACESACETRQSPQRVANTRPIQIIGKKCDAARNRRPAPVSHKACVEGFKKGTEYYAKKGLEARAAMDECHDGNTAAVEVEATPKVEEPMQATPETKSQSVPVQTPEAKATIVNTSSVSENATATTDTAPTEEVVDTPKLRASRTPEVASVEALNVESATIV